MRAIILAAILLALGTAQSFAASYALVNSATGVVDNIIEWDGATPYTPPSGHTAVLAASGVGIGWSYANDTFTAPTLPTPTPAQIAAAALASGLAVTCAPGATACTSAIAGTYGVGPTNTAALTSIVTSLAANAGLPGGGSTFVYLDATGVPHTFNSTQIVELGAAVRDYIYALDLFAVGAGSQPSASTALP